MRLASRHGLTLYYAAYLELAHRRRLPLAMLDRELRVAAKAEGFWEWTRSGLEQLWSAMLSSPAVKFSRRGQPRECRVQKCWTSSQGFTLKDSERWTFFGTVERRARRACLSSLAYV